jgi:hypothetical protein
MVDGFQTADVEPEHRRLTQKHLLELHRVERQVEQHTLQVLFEPSFLDLGFFAVKYLVAVQTGAKGG